MDLIRYHDGEIYLTVASPQLSRKMHQLWKPHGPCDMTSAQLDSACGELTLTNDWMDEQGSDAGYEQVRKFRSDDDHFEVDFELGSQAHKEWVRLNGTASS